MLNRRYRFHSRGGVRYVYQKGKTIRKPKASLVFAENSRGFTRVAVVVSKKVMKSAVGRNRIRRRIYEVIRNNFDLFPKKMPLPELEKLLGELVEESKVCYTGSNE